MVDVVVTNVHYCIFINIFFICHVFAQSTSLLRSSCNSRTSSGCHDIYEKPFMWYLVKCPLKVQVEEVPALIVVSCVVGVNDTGKEVKQVC